MKKPRVSRWMTDRSSNTPGRDVSIRCINSDARLFAHLEKVSKISRYPINPKLSIPIGQSPEENSHDFHSTFHNTKGTRDCEHQQPIADYSYTSQWSGGGHLPER